MSSDHDRPRPDRQSDSRRPTHGAQQLTLFNGHYDSCCNLPLVAFLTFGKETDQYLVSTLLRPGNAPAKNGSIALLSRLLPRLRTAFPGTRFLVRLDGGIAAPDIFDFFDQHEDVDHVVGMATNRRLERKAGRFLREARRRYRRRPVSCLVFGAFAYAARKWPRQRWVIVKAEILRYDGLRAKPSPRFVVTNLYRLAPRTIYETLYCARAHVENRIKDLHDSLGFGRTSCSRFLANQFRLLLSTAAFVLMQEVRRAAAGSKLAGAQAARIRGQLLKIGVAIAASVHRVVFHPPEAFPFRKDWLVVARSLGADTG